MCRYIWLVWLAAALLAVGTGCGSAPVIPPPPETAESFPAAPTAPGSDQFLLKEALQGRTLSPPEVVGLSDRLLAGGNSASQDQETMARLELVLLKALKTEDQANKAALWRNLGIIHYNQKKYDRAQQELKKANEFNPKDARTHFYLARLFSSQAEVCQRKGQKKKAQGLSKQAAIELELARKIAPGNPAYRQDLKQLMQQEQGK